MQVLFEFLTETFATVKVSEESFNVAVLAHISVALYSFCLKAFVVYFEERFLLQYNFKRIKTMSTRSLMRSPSHPMTVVKWQQFKAGEEKISPK